MTRQDRDRRIARNAGVVEAREVCEGHERAPFSLYMVEGVGLGVFGIAACCEARAIRYGASLLTPEERARAWANVRAL